MPVLKGPLHSDGNSIRVMRVVRGLSMRQLGTLADIAPHRLFKIEHELIAPTGEELARLMGCLTSEGRDR